MNADRAAARIDAFPYLHRLSDVMGEPICIATTDSLKTAAKLMVERKASALLIVDAGRRPVGIVTESDIMRAFAQEQPDEAPPPLADAMSHPVITLPSDALVYQALGRMWRHGIRHIVATDAEGAVVGMVGERQLLRQRAEDLPLYADAIDSAPGSAELRAVHDGLPGFAARLTGERISAPDIAAILSELLAQIYARAATLAEAELRARRGEAPAPWCLLALGSVGRGESLLTADQDHAICHGGGAVDADGWFADFGARLSTLLDQAGIPLCKGGVMSSNPVWRGSLEDWDHRLQDWVRHPDGQSVLNIDIFFDFKCVYGDEGLATQLRKRAGEIAAGSPVFLQQLALHAAQNRPPLSIFGLYLAKGGRIDLKRSGLLPLIGAARAMALKHRIEDTGTMARLAALNARSLLPADDVDRIAAAFALFLRLILNQQLENRGLPGAGSSIQPRKLHAMDREALAEAFAEVDRLRGLLIDVIAD